MSTISYVPFTDNVIASTATVNSTFDVLNEVNGSLNADNVATIDKELDYTYLQHRAATGGQMVGGTANLDYFNGTRYVFVRTKTENRYMNSLDQAYLSYLSSSRGMETAFEDASIGSRRPGGRSHISSAFPGVTDAVQANRKIPIAIPGASLSFFLPFKAHVLVTWQVTWTSDAARFGPTPTVRVDDPYLPPTGDPPGGFFARKDVPKDDDGFFLSPSPSDFPEPNTAIRFYVGDNEYKQECTTRETREAMFAHPQEEKWADGYDNRKNSLDSHKLRDRHKSRYWSGHAYIGEKLKGFHSVSLRVCSQEIVRQTRVRARNIKVVYFKA